ncbi:MAG: enoyl-CoA hydratase/isomerase family protein [Acidimicrobiales bacterium]|nr:enoyl-CoA hydratase/isomerase family protein [Acidimicrobiales bacterium]
MLDCPEERFLIEKHAGRVAHLVMNRPEKLNAMDRLFVDQLTEWMGRLSSDTDVNCIVLRGSGRAFSAGGDIATFPPLTESKERAEEHVGAVFAAFHSIQECAVPVIAAVHGIAHGGGLEITMACDMAIASVGARFAFREVDHGLIPGFGITRAAVKIGLPWTMRLASSAEEIDAAIAQEIGIVMNVVEEDDLISSAHDLALSIACHSRHALEAVKHHLNRDSATGIDKAVIATAGTFEDESSHRAISEFLTPE